MQQPRQKLRIHKSKADHQVWLAFCQRETTKPGKSSFELQVLYSLSRRRRIFAPPRPLSRKCVGPVVGDPYHDSLFSWSVQMNSNLMGMCPFLWRVSMETWQRERMGFHCKRWVGKQTLELKSTSKMLNYNYNYNNFNNNFN